MEEQRDRQDVTQNGEMMIVVSIVLVWAAMVKMYRSRRRKSVEQVEMVIVGV